MIDFLMKAGPAFMIPLLLLSITSWAFIIERFYRYRKVPKDKNAEEFLQEMKTVLTNDGPTALDERLSKEKGLLANVWGQLANRLNLLIMEKRSVQQMREELQFDSENYSRDYLEQYLAGLNTISTLSPLVGLLGTIVGMIQAFDAIARQGAGDPQAVAGGINTALITTAAGLVIAIPSILGYNYFRRRVEQILKRLEPFTHLFINELIQEIGRPAVYRDYVEQVYHDDVVTDKEKELLKAKQSELRLSAKVAREVEEAVKTANGIENA
ncbi:MAG: MotA/TolQ/ExbB proton channel family protein [Lentisphaeria bacterium]|nr:MotA/TolQ/ExbB proton channel family protein [Candidatus Neomarinimicrobiota bacterium]MCF7842570.1 MotA/TolQ/ExbB proton channel family protein [Lentisphaeria bacterium]